MPVAKAGWTVSSSLICGNESADIWGSVTVDAGANISGKVKSTGYVRLRAGGHITGGAEGTYGWLDVNATQSIQGDFIAGDEAIFDTVGFTAASVTAGDYIRVHATGDVRKSGGGFNSTGGWVSVQTAGTMFQDVRATGNIRIQAVTAIIGATVVSSAADTWVVANGPISGSFTGKYVADVRTTVVGAEVTGLITVTAPATDPGSAWSKRNQEINDQLADLMAQGKVDSVTAQDPRTEQQLLGVQPPPAAGTAGALGSGDLEPSKLELDENRIPAQRVRDLLIDPIFIINQTWPAYEYPVGKDITLKNSYLGTTSYSTAGYVIFTDVTGLNGQVLVLEPFHKVTKYYSPGPGGVGTYTTDESLLGDPYARTKAEFYRVVSRISDPLGSRTPEQWLANVRTESYAENRIWNIVLAKHGENLDFQATVMDIGVSMVPLLGTANEIAKNGFTWDAALSFGSDVTTVLGVGLVVKAKLVATGAAKTAKAAQNACKTTRIVLGTNAVVDGATGVTRLAEGLHALGGDNPGSAWGIFGDGMLRLFGLSVSAIKFMRTKCWVAGTPVHTSDGLTAIEAVRPGDRVWAFDRAARRWELRAVEPVHRLSADELATVRLGDGTELVGTPGHPVWVSDGVDLAGRATGDHAHDEPATTRRGGTSGRCSPTGRSTRRCPRWAATPTRTRAWRRGVRSARWRREVRWRGRSRRRGRSKTCGPAGR